MEEPVHHQQQHEDGEKTGGRLDLERRQRDGQVAHDADRETPCDDGGTGAERDAQEDGLLIAPSGPRHVRGDGRQDQDALEPFAEDQNGDVEDAHAAAGPCKKRFKNGLRRTPWPIPHGRALRGQSGEAIARSSG